MKSQTPFPWRLVPPLAGALLLIRRRSFRADAVRALDCLQPPLTVSGQENIPPQAPYIVAINHYSGPGFGSWWLTLAISACLPEEVCWVISAAWRFEGFPGGQVLQRLSRRMFRRLAQVYGFITMPPLPPDPAELSARTEAVRRILALARRPQPPVIGLAPEGRDARGGVMIMPEPGVGRMISHLAQQGYRVLPAGIYVDDGLHIRFGEVFLPSSPPGLNPDQRDLFVRRLVMTRLAALLPGSLAGEFSSLPLQDHSTGVL